MRDGELRGQWRNVTELSEDQRREMFRLMGQFFENVSWEQFLADLTEKRWVLLLRDSGEILRGFSTLTQMQVQIDAESANVLFSGDTIVSPDFWQETELFRVWIAHVMSIAEQSPETRTFWFLISSGYKTYRMLPLFFRDFIPRYDSADPDLNRILEMVALARYPEEFEPQTGVIRLKNPTPLRSGVAEVTEARLTNPHIKFFHDKNPDHGRGDELACLAEISRSNLTSAGARMLKS